MGRALIVVDVQIDFCPGGSLAVEGGDDVAAAISEHLDGTETYDLIVATADWHPSSADSSFEHFSDHPDYRDTWPPHCVQGTTGAAFHQWLCLPEDTVVVRKGQHDAAYSGFEGHDDQQRTLEALLRDAGVQRLDVVGLATDHCVRATALDGVELGFAVRVLTTLTAGVDPATTQRALDDMVQAGVTIAA